MPELTYAQALNAALREELRRDSAVLVMGEDVGVHGGVFTVTRGLLAEFGAQRVMDTPISEAAFVGLGAGAAMIGLRPVIEIMYMDFMFVCSDSIVNQAAKMRYMTGGQVKVPMVIRTQQGGGRGNGAQHSQTLDAMWAQVPGLKVVAPSTPHDAKGLLKAAIRDDNPVMFIEHKLLYPTKGEVPDGDYTVPIGKAEVRRAGTDVTIAAISRSVLLSLQAADALAQQGISAEVIDVRSLRPFDAATILESVRKTHRLVVAHESVPACSMVSEIAATVQEQAFDWLDGPVQRVTGADAPSAYSQPVEQSQIPTPEKIVAAVKRVMG